jgi:hypothetical protein
MTSAEANKLGMGKSTLWALQRRARDEKCFTTYSKVTAKLQVTVPEPTIDMHKLEDDLNARRTPLQYASGQTLTNLLGLPMRNGRSRNLEGVARGVTQLRRPTLDTRKRKIGQIGS